MKQWEIWHYPFEKERPHPVVIISNDERAERAENVNALLCVSCARRAAAPHEVLSTTKTAWTGKARAAVIFSMRCPAPFLRHAPRPRQQTTPTAIARKINEVLRLVNP